MRLNNKKAYWLLIIAAAFAGAFISRMMGIAWDRTPFSASAMASGLRKTSADMNSRLPMMIDSETRLDNTLVVEETFVYNYTLIHYNSGQITETDINTFLATNILNKYCTTDKSFSQMGVASNYNYYGNDAKLIGVVKVTPQQCNHTPG